MLSPRAAAILQAVLVTVLWASSWVLIKSGLEEIPAVTFAGLRYTVAFLCLLPFLFRTGRIAGLRRLTRPAWGGLILLGLLFYTVNQGAVFVALAYLPALTANLVLSFTTVLVGFLSLFLLNERPTAGQWLGVLVYLGGVIVYFYPAALPAGQLIGLLAALAGVVGNALSAILGRGINRSRRLDPLSVTIVSMGIGSLVLLAIGLATQGMPRLSPAGWGIVLWLAVVNSAFAFALWNRTLQTLTAVESSAINSLLLVEIPVLAVLLLGETLTWRGAAGLLLALFGILLIQFSGRLRADLQGP
jgi:drug/metabolite transporter (DMT)-like permease